MIPFSRLTKLFGIFLFLFGITNGIMAQNFSAIDTYAQSAPKSAQKTTKTLAAYLNKKASTDIKKVRAYYVWLAYNIKYDTKAFFSNNPNPKTNTEDVLKYKKAVCQGYAQLFKELCQFSNIPCHLVSGYSKGYGYSSQKDFHNSDHAWNAIYINNNWQLVDATWGSGYVNDNKKYVKKFTAEYFLPKPEHFILKHLPSDPMWQLITCPISINDYKKSDIHISQILQNCNGTFNFTDTIAAYLKLNPANQQMQSAERAFKFNPDNVEAPGYALLNLSYEMGAELNNYYNNKDYKQALKLNRQILEINEKALQFLRKSKTEHSKSAVNTCKQNIKSTKENIKSLEKFINQ